MKSNSILCPDPYGQHRMAFVEWGQPSSLPPVICIHGLTRNGRDFDWLAEALAASGRHVICPDMVGRGLSDWMPDHPEIYNYATYIADINLLLAEKNIKQVDWVGTSMGGLIGMMMAAVPDTPLRKLVLNDVGPYLPVAALKRIAGYVAMSIEFADAAQLERHMRQIYLPFGITKDDDWRRLTATSMHVLPSGKIRLAHDVGIAHNFKPLEQDVDLWQVYDAIKCPTLLMRGANSDVLSAEVAEQMTQRGPQAKLITYAGIGHAPALMDEGQIEDCVTFCSA